MRCGEAQQSVRTRFRLVRHEGYEALGEVEEPWEHYNVFCLRDAHSYIELVHFEHFVTSLVPRHPTLHNHATHSRLPQARHGFQAADGDLLGNGPYGSNLLADLFPPPPTTKTLHPTHDEDSNTEKCSE